MTAARFTLRLACGWRLRAAIIGLAAASCVASASAQPAAIAPLHQMAHRKFARSFSPLHYTTLSSEMAGRIDRIATRVGDHFREGDVLIIFDCAVPRAQLARAQAVVTQAERTFEIDRRLVALRSMGQLELDVAAAEILKAKADQVAAEAVASKCSIAAPFSGVTVEQKAREFQYTTPGQPLLDILDDHALEVELLAPSHWLSWLKPGYAFQVKIDETKRPIRPASSGSAAASTRSASRSK